LAKYHLDGIGCKKCFNEISRTKGTNKFIHKAKIVHGDKYDYSKANYISAKTKVTITCPVHGEFDQIANYHLSGNGCIKCGYISSHQKRKKDTRWFKEQSKKIHGGFYDYSLSNYTRDIDKIKIICPKHGDFE